MKKIILLVTVLFSLNAGNIIAAPVPVTILSSDFSISGYIDGQDAPFIPQLPFSDGYDQSGSVPLSNGVANGDKQFATIAQSSAGFFSVSAFAYASLNTSTDALAQASAEWIFQPTSLMDKLTISYHSGWSGSAGSSIWGRVVLTDTTDGTEIFRKQMNVSGFQGYNGSDSIDYSFQTDRAYQLHLLTTTQTCYDPISFTITASDVIPAIPESATLLLMGLGLMGLVVVRNISRDRMNHKFS